MTIRVNTKPVTKIVINSKVVSKVYVGTKLVSGTTPSAPSLNFAIASNSQYVGQVV